MEIQKLLQGKWDRFNGNSETKWKGIGQVKSDNYSVYISGNDNI